MKEQLIKEITYYGKDEIESKLTILGRPITLEDILIAVSKKLQNGDVVNLHITDRNTLCFRVKDSLIDYELGKTANEQSVETLQFIRDILK